MRVSCSLKVHSQANSFFAKSKRCQHKINLQTAKEDEEPRVIMKLISKQTHLPHFEIVKGYNSQTNFSLLEEVVSLPRSSKPFFILACNHKTK